MKLLNTIKESCEIVVNNPSITLFLVLFLIIINFSAAYVLTFQSKAAAALLITGSVLACVFFLSGWFQILREASIKDKENKNYPAIFLEGTGKNIIPVAIGIIIYTILALIVFFITGKIALKLFGSLDFVMRDIVSVAPDSNSLAEFFKGLSDNQKYTILSWQLSFIFASLVFNFLLLFYFPAIIYEEEANALLKPFIALYKSFVFLFKNFFPSLFLYFVIYSVYIFLGISRGIAGNNAFFAILLLFIYIYFACCSVMLIFNYYGKKDNCIDRCDCIGQNSDGDRTCEED